MRDLISEWLTSRKEQIILFEDEDEIILKHQGNTLLLGAQLTSIQPDRAVLQNWMRLGAASLSHFQGALALKSESGALWLVQNVQGVQSEGGVLSCLEALLNQRDTWRATLARLARPHQNIKPTSLRSLSY